MTLAFVAFIISKHNIYPLSHWLTFSHYKDHLRDTTHYLYLFHSADFLVHTEVSSLSFPIEFQVNYCIIFFKYQITMRVTSRHFTQHSEELTVLQQETPTTLCWNRVMEGRYSAQWNSTNHTPSRLFLCTVNEMSQWRSHLTWRFLSYAFLHKCNFSWVHLCTQEKLLLGTFVYTVC